MRYARHDIAAPLYLLALLFFCRPRECSRNRQRYVGMAAPEPRVGARAAVLSLVAAIGNVLQRHALTVRKCKAVAALATRDCSTTMTSEPCVIWPVTLAVLSPLSLISDSPPSLCCPRCHPSLILLALRGPGAWLTCSQRVTATLDQAMEAACRPLKACATDSSFSGLSRLHPLPPSVSRTAVLATCRALHI